MSESNVNSMESMQRQGQQMAVRIAQAYPFLSEGLDVGNFVIEFDHQIAEAGSPIARTFYDEDGNLETIELNKTTLEEQYDRLKEQVSFQELVSLNVGIGVCMDLLFRQIADRNRRSSNMTFAMLDRMNDPQSIKRSLLSVDEEFATNGHLERAANMLLDEKHTGPEKIVRINAQRIAFGMVMVAESMYDSDLGERAALAVRDDIRELLTNHSVATAMLGLALTSDMETALKVAADTILDARDLPLAIPANRTEIEALIHALQVANIRPEQMTQYEVTDLADMTPHSTTEEEIADLSGFTVTDKPT